MLKKEFKQFTIMKALMECVEAGESDIQLPTIREMAGLSYPATAFNQFTYGTVDEGYITKKSIGSRINVYAMTAKGRKYLEKNKGRYAQALLSMSVEEAFPPNGAVKTPRASEPEPILTHTENSAIEGLSNLIDENKRFRGMLTRLHIEIGMALGLNEKDNIDEHTQSDS